MFVDVKYQTEVREDLKRAWSTRVGVEMLILIHYWTSGSSGRLLISEYSLCRDAPARFWRRCPRDELCKQRTLKL